MIWIKPDQTYNLEYEYGAVFWNYETQKLYGVGLQGITGSTSKRFIRNLTDLSEDLVHTISFPSDVRGDSNTLAADFFSGQLGVLVNRKAPITGSSRTKTIPCIYWFPWGVPMPTDYSHLYGGTTCFARVARTVGDYTFHFSDSDGNFARWSSSWTDTKYTPESQEELVPWRGEYGQVRSLAWKTPPESTGASIRHLVIASPSGAIRWADMQYWMLQNKVMPIYKELGVIKCGSLRDITIDRNNNLLWILDGTQKLHLVVLEPFGTEETGYTNAPRALQMTPELRAVDPLQEMTIEAQLLDMWGQPVALQDKEVQFVSAGLGEFEDGDDWSITVTTNTDGDGIARAVYRGSESNS